jgi:23S rRNA (adenine2030-N6)-methyltransferase
VQAAVAAVNYRHAFHAGNFADCVKHALLLEILEAMQRKEKPLFVLDTHAGIGRYDLTAGPAETTGEWRDGIGKVMAVPPAALRKFVAMVEAVGLYPGSPAIVASALRAGDKLVACELHPEDAAALRAEFAGRRDVSVHERDGYAAIRAFLPPAEKRGLILVDPPYERPDEFEAVVKNVVAGWQKFRSGVFAVWYPIKHLAPVRHLFEAVRLAGVRDVVAASFWRRPPTDPKTLNGCGLLVVNPPFGFEAAAGPVLAACADVFGEAGAGFGVERLVAE